MTRAESLLPVQVGNSHFVASQPGWTRRPISGGSPVTLPVRRKRPASNPLGTFTSLPSSCVTAGLRANSRSITAAAAAMHVANGGADLGVAVSGQRLLDEIDKPGLALECGQKRDCIAAGRRFGRRRLLGLRRRRRRPVAICRAIDRPAGQSPL